MAGGWFNGRATLGSRSAKRWPPTQRGTGVYADMEQWTEVRRRVLTGELSKRAACRQYQLHWRTLEKMLAHDEPPGYQRRQPVRRPKIDPFLTIIHQILQDDRQAPKKQRHTAWRIFQRLVDEHQFTGRYTIVKEAVRVWKQTRREVFVPLVHRPTEAQVDFGFAWVDLADERVQAALFVMTLPYSDAIYLQAFPRECTEAFLEGHRRAFAFFEGVPPRISYDNSKIAVAKITGSRSREKTREFLRLQSHYLFQDHFCLVRRANEKGHVERLLDYGRENFLVPVPRVASLAELNGQLEQRCRDDLSRHLRTKPAAKHALLAEQRAQLLPLPAREFEARRVTQAAADSLSLVRFDANSYSVPVQYAHRQLTVVATVDQVRLVYEDRLVACHARHWGRGQHRFDPVHYLALLEHKPGGFDHARPLADWNLPGCFETLRRRLEQAPHGLGLREYIRVLRLLEQASLAELTEAVEYALDLDVTDADSVRVIVEHRRERPIPLFSLDGRPHLASVQVEPTQVAVYQALLEEAAP